jgi:PAS domain S-box-containing protein
VIFHHHTTQEAEISTSYGTSAAFHALRYPLAGSLAGWVVEYKRPLRVERLTPEEWPTSWRLGEQLGAPPTRVSVLLAPLWVQGEVAGSLEVVWEPFHSITDRDEQLLEAVAVQAAIAITNARLYQEKERALQAVKESEERFRDLFENANDAIVTLTLDGIITNANRGAEVLLGRAREEGIGRHYRQFLTPRSVALSEERTRHILAGEKVSSIYEIELIRKDGSVVPVEVRARFIRDKQGNPVGIQTIHRDISARKALEQQRADFLAMLTHDIRTPLSIILGYTEMLLEETGDLRGVGAAEILGRIRSSGLTVHSLVANYLDLSRIETGQLLLKKEFLQLNDLLLQVGRQYETEARHRHLTLDIQLQPDVPLIVVDATALERVFANLLHNALKFTPKEGQVTIRSARTGGEVVVTIADTGPGLAPEEIPLLFEKYRRAKHSKHQAGTGLGLFIVKSIIEAHEGRIKVDSTLGAGTCFSVFLPMGDAGKG